MYGQSSNVLQQSQQHNPLVQPHFNRQEGTNHNRNNVVNKTSLTRKPVETNSKNSQSSTEKQNMKHENSNTVDRGQKSENSDTSTVHSEISIHSSDTINYPEKNKGSQSDLFLGHDQASTRKHIDSPLQ